jgi:alpha-tubulin suppressor-like RCC1 family protein
MQRRMIMVMFLVFATLTASVGPAVASASALAAPQAQHQLSAMSLSGVHGWGGNERGEVGDLSATDRPAPVAVAGVDGVGFLNGITRISVGGIHSLGLRADGTVVAWGDNEGGQLGIGTTGGWVANPVVVTGLAGVVAIAAGEAYSVAVKATGTVWVWGAGTGVLGPTGLGSSAVPVQIPSLAGVTAVATTGEFVLALKNDGTVVGWGRNDLGQLGNGTQSFAFTPVPVAGLAGVVAIAAGETHAVALKSDGTVWAWGSNTNFGLTGQPPSVPWSLTPVQVAGLTGVTAIAAGGYHSLALKGDGTVWGWGINYNNALGVNGYNASTGLYASATPVQASGLTGITAIAAGTYHSLALKGDGTVWGWGLNDSGQAGVGTTGPYGEGVGVPTQVAGLAGAMAIAAGGYNSFAWASTAPNPSPSPSCGSGGT